jgi:L-cystine transport system permease protein
MDRPFSLSAFLDGFPRFLEYLPATLAITLLTVLFGLALGAMLAWARLSKHRAGRACSWAYIMSMRCAPAIVLLFIVYYGLPAATQALFHADIEDMPKIVFVVAALTLLFAAAMSETMRSAYLSVDKGQREAAVSAGLSEAQAFWRIVFPQALPAALPNFCNALLGLLKAGALAYTIGMIDMMGAGNLFITQHYGSYTLETYCALALIYWALSIAIEKSLLALERYLSRGKKAYQTQS